MISVSKNQSYVSLNLDTWKVRNTLHKAHLKTLVCISSPFHFLKLVEEFSVSLGTNP